ncbi:sugar phosphate isomerase/epimerase [Panacibacter ginsenosidivorans]|uniref:Sugar phosphate isomerase/epimerase n=1 Tax=Panacibacter ginsenosidivorans TaxID=1813871 RepID=A0A5B8V6P1_9BACT|nr:sugar phosphate isomerase/epimerase [Panacibacter ginsenosidivorans]QEC67140.1 sugar phosphate isomerase/epimerase [Panacibacter ginsenosidivorans]
MFDLGFVSAILADNSFEEVVDFAAINDFKCVEMMCWPKGKAERRYAGVTHIDVNALTKNDVAYIKDYLQQKNIYISGLGYYPNPLVADTAQAKVFLDHIKKIIKAATLLNIPVVNTFIGRDHTKSIDDNFKVFLKRWPAIIKFAEDNGINIGIENCPMYFTKDEWPGGKNLAISPAIWARMFEALPSKNFGLNYDPSHMIWQQMDPIQPIYDFKDRMHHIHLKDAKLYKNKLDKVGIMAHPLEYHSPKLPGLGDVKWNNFFTALTDIRYKGPVCIEVEDKAFEGSAASIEKAILTARNYLTQFIA